MPRDKKTNEQIEFEKGIAERIRFLRTDRIMSQETLAARIGTSHENIRKYETGKSPVPMILLPSIAEEFDVSIDYLLTGDESKTPPDPRVQGAMRLTGLSREAIENLRDLGDSVEIDEDSIAYYLDRYDIADEDVFIKHLHNAANNLIASRRFEYILYSFVEIENIIEKEKEGCWYGGEAFEFEIHRAISGMSFELEKIVNDITGYRTMGRSESNE